MKKIIYLVPFLILASCVSQSDYDKLKSDNEELEQKVADLESELSSVELEYNQLLEEKRQAEIERTKKKYYSEEQAKGYIKDYYDFYASDTRYRNVRLRRLDNNSFKVSLETCTKKANFSNDDFFWNSGVYNLVINNDGTYKFTRSF